MSSGLPLLLRRLRSLLQGDTPRIEELSKAGMITKVDELAHHPKPDVIEIDIGFGTEFWVVRSSPLEFDNNLRYIVQGRLIVDQNGNKATSKTLKLHNIHWRRSAIRI